jgi:hypothetical protein
MRERFAPRSGGEHNFVATYLKGIASVPMSISCDLDKTHLTSLCDQPLYLAVLANNDLFYGTIFDYFGAVHFGSLHKGVGKT